MSKGVCIAPTGKAEVAFAELHEVWTSSQGAWKVEAKVESLESLPKYKVRTVAIYKRHPHTMRYARVDNHSKLHIPVNVLDKYDEFVSLANEMR